MATRPSQSKNAKCGATPVLDFFSLVSSKAQGSNSVVVAKQDRLDSFTSLARIQRIDTMATNDTNTKTKFYVFNVDRYSQLGPSAADSDTSWTLTNTRPNLQ